MCWPFISYCLLRHTMDGFQSHKMSNMRERERSMLYRCLLRFNGFFFLYMIIIIFCCFCLTLDYCFWDGEWFIWFHFFSFFNYGVFNPVIRNIVLARHRHYSQCSFLIFPFLLWWLALHCSIMIHAPLCLIYFHHIFSISLFFSSAFNLP